MDHAPPLDVLIIDDNEGLRANLVDLIELFGHRATTAATAAEALDRDDWGRFAVILLDRVLPDGMADQLLPRLRAAAPDAAVIIMTGLVDLEAAIAAMRQGAADYLIKPFNPDQLLANLERVSERQRLARAKERSEAAFRNLVEAAECMIVMLRPDRSILYLSPFAERLTGYESAEVLGRDYLELFLPEPGRPAASAALDALLAGTPIRGREDEILRRDGTRRSMVWNGRLLPEHDEGPAILLVGQDITGVKQAQARALQAERLAAIGQVVAGLAHESRNALQRSQACLEMLGLCVRDRPEALDLLARLQRAQDHLHHLYEDVRGYAAPIQLERRPCDLGEVWREAWAHLEAARRDRPATLRERAEGVDLRVLGDPFRLGQVFRNVLDNALAAGRPPIAVEIAAEPVEFEGRPALRVAIADDGPGLDPDARASVFEPFFTTKAKGTGLGMPIAKRIVESHGGQIAVGDPAGPGAVFLLTIPRGK